MLKMNEPRRTGMCGKGSEMSFVRDASEYIATAQDFHLVERAAWIASRRSVSNAVARVLAEHSAGLIHSRGSR